MSLRTWATVAVAGFYLIAWNVYEAVKDSAFRAAAGAAISGQPIYIPAYARGDGYLGHIVLALIIFGLLAIIWWGPIASYMLADETSRRHQGQGW